MSLVYLEDAEKGREAVEIEARRQHTEAEWRALPSWKRQSIIEWKRAGGNSKRGIGKGRRIMARKKIGVKGARAVWTARRI